MADYDQVVPIATRTIDGPNVGTLACGNSVGIWCSNMGAAGATSAPGMTRACFLHARLDPYVKNIQVWVCPSMGGIVSLTADNTSYGSTLACVNTWPNTCLQNTRESAFVMSPAEIPLLMDSVAWSGTPANMLRSATTADVRSPHGSTINQAYLDGHVKTLPCQGWYQAMKDSAGSNTPLRPWK